MFWVIVTFHYRLQKITDFPYLLFILQTKKCFCENILHYSTVIITAKIMMMMMMMIIWSKKIEELKTEPMHGQFYQELEKPSKSKNPWHGYVVAQA